LVDSPGSIFLGSDSFDGAIFDDKRGEGFVFPFLLGSISQYVWGECPEGFDEFVDAIILVDQFDVIFLCPEEPFLEASWGRTVVAFLVFLDGLWEGLALAGEFGFPGL